MKQIKFRTAEDNPKLPAGSKQFDAFMEGRPIGFMFISDPAYPNWIAYSHTYQAWHKTQETNENEAMNSVRDWFRRLGEGMAADQPEIN